MTGQTDLGLSRVVLLGVTGSGKSTLREALAQAIGAPGIELDDLHHGPGWVPRPSFLADVDAASSAPAWVIDGNYIDKVSELVWPRAQLIVWLDLPLPLVLLRLTRRSLGRIVRRTELWQGNRETLATFLGRNSILRWALSSHRDHSRRLPVLLSPPQLQGVSVVRLRSRGEVSTWLAAVTGKAVRSPTKARPGQPADVA